MSVESSVTAIILLGVLFLGMFVGFVLGTVLTSAAGTSVKIAGAVISAALAGAPVAFMSGLAFERWMYPIGLVVGLAWTRMLTARKHALSSSKRTAIFAWIDMIAIAGATLVVIIVTALVR